MSRKWRGGPGSRRCRAASPPRARPWRRRPDPAHVAGHSRATLSRMPTASSISRSPTISGGRMRSTLSPAVRHKQPLAAQFRDDIAGRHVAADAEQQPGAAQFGEQPRVIRDQLFEPAAQQPRHPLDPLEEAGLQHHVEHGVAARDRHRVAAERRAVRPRDHAGSRLLGRQTRADREPVPERLRDRHDVRRHAGPFMREQLAGAAHAASAPRHRRAAARTRRRSSRRPLR